MLKKRELKNGKREREWLKFEVTVNATLQKPSLEALTVTQTLGERLLLLLHGTHKLCSGCRTSSHLRKSHSWKNIKSEPVHVLLCFVFVKFKAIFMANIPDIESSSDRIMQCAVK